MRISIHGNYMSSIKKNRPSNMCPLCIYRPIQSYKLVDFSNRLHEGLWMIHLFGSKRCISWPEICVFTCLHLSEFTSRLFCLQNEFSHMSQLDSTNKISQSTLVADNWVSGVSKQITMPCTAYLPMDYDAITVWHGRIFDLLINNID